MLVDSHIHLTHHLFDESAPCVISLDDNKCIKLLDREKLIDEMKNAGVACFVEPGIDLKSNYELCELAERQAGIFPAVGVHPTRVINEKWKDRKIIRSLAISNNVVAIGETGLDYHMNPSAVEKFWQKRWFKWHIHLALELQLPLILHIRSANEDAVKFLKRYKKRIVGGVCHCFNDNADVARIYTEELGLYLGIGGSLLQSNADHLVDAVIHTPLEYILIETDGPYVKPQKPQNISTSQWKKARNTSFILHDIVAKIAEVKGVDFEMVERITTENAARLFSLKL